MNTVIKDNLINKNYPESELTGKIIGCAMEVHKILGNGFQEVIYQRALAIEMQKQLMDFSREHEMDLEAYGMEVGLLINFGSRSLQFKGVMKPNKKS